jgi:hypothetical protein
MSDLNQLFLKRGCEQLQRWANRRGQIEADTSKSQNNTKQMKEEEDRFIESFVAEILDSAERDRATT